MAIKDTNVRRQITIDKDFYKTMLKYAKDNNTTLSKLVVTLLTEELKKGDNKNADN